MPLERPNPINIEVVEDESLRLNDKAFQDLKERIEATDRDQSTWLQKMLTLQRLLYGPRRGRSVPWKGAANINVPMTDGIIRRWRPGIVSLILDAEPTAFFTSENKQHFEAARDAETFFSWLLKEKMRIGREVFRLTHLMALRGHCYAREGWRYETERYSRVVRAEELFPGGVGAFVQQQQAQMVQQGQEPQRPEGIVSAVLEAEYGMSIDDEKEGRALLAAATGLLQGAPAVRIAYEGVIKDEPSWTAIDPVNVIVEQGCDVENADYFVIIHEFTRDDLARCARDSKFNKEATLRVIERMDRDNLGSSSTSSNSPNFNQRQLLRQQANRRAGIADSQTGSRAKGARTTIWEIYAKMDVNDDDIDERAVIWYAPDADEKIAAYEYPYPFDAWPVTLYQFEAYAERPAESRGIVELLYELQKLANEWENARINIAQIVLSPVFKLRNAGLNAGQRLRWKPGAFIPVSSPNDIEPLAHDMRPLTLLLQEQQLTQRQAESYIGSFDATLGQLTAPTERRTAAEVNAITQLASNVFGLDARMFQESTARSYNKIWSLFREFGPPEVVFQVTGEEMPRTVRKRDIGKRFDIKPAGSPASTNRALMLSNVERVLPLILQDQSGIFDKSEALRHWLQLLDTKLADKVIRSPEETEQAQLVMQAAQIAAQRQGGNPEAVQSL